MPNNYVLLDRIELNATTASVTFDNIPQTGYTDLKVVASARSTHTNVLDELILRFNSSATGYTNRFVMGDGSTAASYANNYTTSGYVGYISANSATANTFGNTDIYIPNYTASQNKSYSSDSVAETNATTQYMNLNAALLSNTAAITSLRLSLGYGSFVAGSTFSLYGVAKLGTTPAIAPKADGGNVIETDGTYWYHTFRTNGTFTPQVNLTCDYLVLAGGGGGGYEPGGNSQPGGGGAGGMRCTVTGTGGGGSLESPLAFVSGTGYAVTIGAGGVGGLSGVTTTNGTSSTLSSITSAGGGSGVTVNAAANAWVAAASGGSGGGGGGGVLTGGAGTANQGYAGGTTAAAGTVLGSGGGGAGAVGTSNNGSQTNVAGGAGVATVIGGASVTYARGGNGGGAGGTAGAVNTGNGGYSGGSSGGAGGSGIVIVRYLVA